MSNKYIHRGPARQLIKDYEWYLDTRIMLYQTLGITKNSVENREILEFGVGYGYNAIVNMEYYNPKFYEMVEINKKACENIEKLFESNPNHKINNTSIEEFKSDKKYSLVVCEGTLAYLNNKFELLQKISSFVEKDGILVVTTIDELSQFYDMARRLLANIIGYKLSEKQKIKNFVKAFETHTKTLNGFSKVIEDWCIDMFLDNELYYNSFSLPDIIPILSKNNFMIYNMASPNLICDERWYRHIDTNPDNYNQYKVDKFIENQHNLFNYKVFNTSREKEKNIELRELCKTFTKITFENENNKKENYIDEILLVLEQIQSNLENKDELITNSLKELSELLKSNFTAEDISNMRYFSQCFGRGQQYISFIKK